MSKATLQRATLAIKHALRGSAERRAAGKSQASPSPNCEEVAYACFFRLIAAYYLRLNGLESAVLGYSEALSSLSPGALPSPIVQTQELLALCRALTVALPWLFPTIGELEESVILASAPIVLDTLDKDTDPDDWKGSPTIIGWLHQYYHSEEKDRAMALLRHKGKLSRECVPAATQVFTPEWVASYLVHNSLGRLWLEGHPHQPTESLWKASGYLQNPECQDSNLQQSLATLAGESSRLCPQDVRLLDPCVGSANMLVAAFDCFVDIYRSHYGWTDTASTVTAILQHNLFGLDIDERVVKLANFVLLATAARYDSSVFQRQIRPHIYCIPDTTTDNSAGLGSNTTERKKNAPDIRSCFLHGRELGALLRFTPDDVARYTTRRESAESPEYDPFRTAATLLSQTYHVVITNPPYLGRAGMNDTLSNFAKQEYHDSKADLCAIFVERGMELCKPNGFVCMLTMQSWMFLSSYQRFRQQLLSQHTIYSLLHMDNLVTGIAFGTAATIWRKCYLNAYRGTYLRLDYADISTGAPDNLPVANKHWSCRSSDFSALPDQPIAYWVSQPLLSGLSNPTIGDIAWPCQGLATGCNERFLRLWHEVAWPRICLHASSREAALASGKKWFPYNKGGKYRRWYGNSEYVVNWERDGEEIRNFRNSAGKQRSCLRNINCYFRPCISWSLVSSGRASFRYKPSGFIFDVSGMSCFSRSCSSHSSGDSCSSHNSSNSGDSRSAAPNSSHIAAPDPDTPAPRATSETNTEPTPDLLLLLALCNSPVADAYLDVFAPTINYQVGDIAAIPVAPLETHRQELTSLVREDIAICQADWDARETSWDFATHPLLASKNPHLSRAFDSWQRLCQKRFDRLKTNEQRQNEILILAYGLAAQLTAEVQNKTITVRLAELGRDVRSLLSYAVGCILGRYSPDYPGLAYAGGEWKAPTAPFQPQPDNIILISTADNAPSLITLFSEWLAHCCGRDTLVENLSFLTDALTKHVSPTKPSECLTRYFTEQFYSDHLKTYQERPLYWMLDSGPQHAFQALFYVHRYQPQQLALLRDRYLPATYRSLQNQLHNQPTVESTNLLYAKLTELEEYASKVNSLSRKACVLDLDQGIRHNYRILAEILAPLL